MGSMARNVSFSEDLHPTDVNMSPVKSKDDDDGDSSTVRDEFRSDSCSTPIKISPNQSLDIEDDLNASMISCSPICSPTKNSSFLNSSSDSNSVCSNGSFVAIYCDDCDSSMNSSFLNATSDSNSVCSNNSFVAMYFDDCESDSDEECDYEYNSDEEDNDESESDESDFEIEFEDSADSFSVEVFDVVEVDEKKKSIFDANERWLQNIELNWAKQTPSKITFNEQVEINEWEDTEDTRASIWMVFVTDQQRFNKRINKVNKEIGWIFNPEHREKVFSNIQQQQHKQGS